MTYAEAVARLLALRGGEHAGMRPGLERIEGVLGALGRPEERYTLVQIGGTNGKGSVAAMLATTLKYAGRRVGLYTSPHLGALANASMNRVTSRLWMLSRTCLPL